MSGTFSIFLLKLNAKVKCMTTQRNRIHFLRFNANINEEGEGLGMCLNFGLTSKDSDKVDCKNCLKRLTKEIK